MRAWACAFHDRKKKKNLFRQIWIQRLNAAVREYKMTYGLFWNTLRKLNIKHNRKMLSELAIRYPEMFKQIVKKVQHSLSHPKS